MGSKAIASLALGMATFGATLLGGERADWPAYQADAARSAITGERLAFPLSRLWEYIPVQPPRPAWPQPGKYIHLMAFDYAFQPVVAGGLVLFGSSADDTLRAVDAETGEARWRFTTGGPIRFAPAVADGKAFIASDDGFVYCLAAATGRLVWQFRAALGDAQLLGNGRMISRWPARTGVLVEDGVAYVTAGMWPAHGICVYALDAATGQVKWCNDGSGSLYINLPHPGSSAFTGVTPQGYLAASRDLLLVPTGRSVPAAYERSTGRLVYYRPSFSWHSGGSWLEIAGDLFLNPRQAWLNDENSHVGEADPDKEDGMAAYKLATGELEWELPGKPTALVAGDILYGVGRGEIQAIDLKALRQKKPLEKCILWKAPHGHAYCLAMAGNAILVGGRGTLAAFDAPTGKELWRSEVQGQVRGLAIAGGRLVAATDRGTIVTFGHSKVTVPAIERREPLTWQLGVSDKAIALAADVLKSPPEGFNTFGRVPAREYPPEGFPTFGRGGYALVLGEPDSRLAAALASQSDLHVICVLSEKVDAGASDLTPPRGSVGASSRVLRGTDKVAAERERLLSTDLYGTRVAVQGLATLARLPFAPYFADLIVVSGDAGDLSGEELYRVLRPCGGVLCFRGVPAEAAKKLVSDGKVPASEVRTAGDAVSVVRGALPGAGEWRFPSADGGRTRIGQESRVRLPLDILWFGGPGPDRMMDRHWGSSPPLFVAGRAFVTGQHHVIAYDAYNGRELWCRELRGAGRFSVDDISSNFVADDDSVYVAAGAVCHRFDQATGRTLAVYTIPEPLTRPPAAAPEPPSVDVEWPTAWQVVGPLPKGTPPLPREALKSVPKQLVVGGKRYAAASLASVEGMLDFTNLYGGYGFRPLSRRQKPGAYPRGDPKTDFESEQKLCYAFAPITCPAPGRLIIGAGSDWWMQWYLDGEPIYDTFAEGNNAHPYAVTNHVFTTEVTAGEHVLAVCVKAGSRGWCLISAGGAKYEPILRSALPGQQTGGWGYLSVAGDLILGTYVPPKASESEARCLFALGKSDGRERWVHKADKAIFNSSIAFGDGKLFLLDGTPQAEVSQAKRRGKKVEPQRTLVALDLAKGSELWRKDNVRPEGVEDCLEYSQGVVVVAANAGYDAATGNRLWGQLFQAERTPLIWRDWVIGQPKAFRLRTGFTRLVPSLLTGEEQAWEFARAYGCGSVAGSQNLLFFRSGMMGFFDLIENGTTTFGAVRPGCSVNMIAAGGLMILPESSSGCTCSYNFQTSLALIPGAPRNDLWYVFPGQPSSLPVKQLRLNLGAPGDRHDTGGAAWLGFPRPTTPGTCPVPVVVPGTSSDSYSRLADRLTIKGTDRPWLYASGLGGAATVLIDLLPPRPVAAPMSATAPKIDGALDDPCWRDASPVPFQANAHLLQPEATLLARRDAANLYLGFRRKAATKEGKPVPFAGKQTGRDVSLARDDGIEILLTDGKGEIGLHFGVSCGGGRFEGIVKIPEKKKGTDLSWNGEWTSVARKGADAWTAEIAIPLKTLADAKLDAASLQINVLAQNASGIGRDRIHLADPGRQGFPRGGGALPVVDRPPDLRERAFTVRLHFAEPEESRKAGDRVFDVALNGQTVLKEFDIVRESGGPNVAIVKELKGVKVRDLVAVSLSPSDPAKASVPVICGIEIIEE